MRIPTAHVPGKEYNPDKDESRIFCSCGWKSKWFSDYILLMGSGDGTEIRRAYEEHFREIPYYGFLII